MNNKRYRKKLGNLLGIIAGIIWISLGISQHFLKLYINIFMVLIGIFSIYLNISLFKEKL